MKNEKGIALIALLVIIALVIFVSVVAFRGSSNNETNMSSTNSKSYGLGDTITYDGLELTFDSTYSFDIVSSTIVPEYNGDYIKLGVNVKNISNEKNYLNSLSYNFFGSKGTQITKIEGYFDDGIEKVGTLKPNASDKAYFYIPYDGDGIYSIDFDKISVEFEITK